jgi:hypothetical protein
MNERRSDGHVCANFEVMYGASGTLTPFDERPVRLKANNQFDADLALLDKYFGEQSIWEVVNGKQLIADFDNGLAQNDALGLLIKHDGLGFELNEGLISKGELEPYRTMMGYLEPKNFVVSYSNIND